jgi:hypothetical protein
MFLSILESYISHAIEPLPVGDVAECQPYVYSPLPDRYSIRLLEIHPGNSPEIHCSLSTVILHNSPSYDALSYTWGDPRPPLFRGVASGQYRRKYRIICDNLGIDVTTNLYNALKRLRQMHHNTSTLGIPALQKYVWVDAICINQQDIAERSSQVALMDELYKGATMAIAWLGKKDRYTDRALRLITRLSERSPNQFRQDMHLSLRHHDIDPDDWQALVAFFRRAYFRRAWIVQEVALARNIIFVCGSAVVSWEGLLKCSQYLTLTGASQQLDIITSYFSSLSDRMARRPLNPTGATLSSLAIMKSIPAAPRGTSNIHWGELLIPINIGRGFIATDPRDHFYSALGIVKDIIRQRYPLGLIQSSLDQLPVPDYAKSVEDVYTEFAIWQLEVSQNLLLLAMVEDRSHRSPDLLETLPSWVPDQTVPVMPYPLHMDANPPGWDPAGPGSSGIGVPIEEGVLMIRGGFFETIKHVADPFNDMAATNNWLSILNLVKPLLGFKYPLSNSAYADVLWRTMTADSDRSHGGGTYRNYPADPALAQAFNEWLITRVFFYEGSIADNQHFHTESYLKVERMLLLAVWDQICEDPGAFKSESAFHNDTEENELRLYNDHEREVFRAKKQSAISRGTILTSLVEVFRADTSGTFFTPLQILRTLGLIDSPNNQERIEMIKRKDAFIAAAKTIIQSRRLFLTDGNYLGIGAQSAQIGDQVWIVSGPSTPFVLRPMQNGRYKLIGEAYVHGIMRGEAVAAGKIRFCDIELE